MKTTTTANALANASATAHIVQNKMTVQLLCAIIMVVTGVAIIFCGIWITPKGVIDNSLLAALGEVLTFAGSVLGVDYHYKAKVYLDKKFTSSEDEKVSAQPTHQ